LRCAGDAHRLGSPDQRGDRREGRSILSGAEAWVDFYLVAGASAAVLIGLLFVGLSINRQAIAAEAHLGGQARQAIFALVSVFVLSLLLLIPDQF
jgi:hypothetical protein